ncbi:MAG: hypothetical protein EA408_13710 [Marinilabiliales bacterium]|nr:MAG: hypothetical protein EA408_13710 [Marinilabiliales bacterium]
MLPKTNTTKIKQQHRRGALFSAAWALLAAVLLLLPSCYKGEYGQPGLAFVAFTWIDDEPAYIEIENEFIPPVFYWDWFYRVDPGLYYIYYEGVHRRGGRLNPYAWELEYEVWENPGKKGKHPWQVGPDGPDAYFTIELTPFGPEVFYEEVYPEKSAQLEDETEIIMNNGDVIIIEKQNKNHTLRLTYRKVAPRNDSNQ